MCTAVSFVTKDHYFGRNLDVERSYNEKITITPKNFPLFFKEEQPLKTHYAIIGTATVIDSYPLYFDGANQHGLCMAGLNFPQNAKYLSFKEGMNNVTPFEFIPYILGSCKTVDEAVKVIKNTNLLDVSFSEKLPLTPLHWIVSDKHRSITVEPLSNGLKIYDNPVGVLTNSPTFDIQMFNLNNYMNLSPKQPKNLFLKDIPLKPYSLGMGGMGLPGDLSSMSRFIRAVFTKENSFSWEDEESSVSQFFHILYSVFQQYGLNDIGDGVYEYTKYSCCINADKGIYYYKTYHNSSVYGVDMNKEDLKGSKLLTYPHIEKHTVTFQN